MDFEGDPRGVVQELRQTLVIVDQHLGVWREGLIRRCLRDQRILLPMHAVTALAAA